jgi:hypothetical protein
MESLQNACEYVSCKKYFIRLSHDLLKVFFLFVSDIFGCDEHYRIYSVDTKPCPLSIQTTEEYFSDSTSTFYIRGIPHCFDSDGRLRFRGFGISEWGFIQMYDSFETAALIRQELWGDQGEHKPTHKA